MNILIFSTTMRVPCQLHIEFWLIFFSFFMADSGWFEVWDRNDEIKGIEGVQSSFTFYNCNRRRVGSCRILDWWVLWVGDERRIVKQARALFSRGSPCWPASPGRTWRLPARNPWCPRTWACPGHRSPRPWTRNANAPGQIASDAGQRRNPLSSETLNNKTQCYTQNLEYISVKISHNTPSIK